MLTFEQYYYEERIENAGQLKMLNGDIHIASVKSVDMSDGGALARALHKRGEAVRLDGPGGPEYYLVNLVGSPSNKGRRGDAGAWAMRKPTNVRHEKELGDDVRVFSSKEFGTDEHVVAAKLSEIEKLVERFQNEGIAEDLPDLPTSHRFNQLMSDLAVEVPLGEYEPAEYKKYKDEQLARAESLPDGPKKTLAMTNIHSFGKLMKLPSQKEILSELGDVTQYGGPLPMQAWNILGVGDRVNKWIDEYYTGKVRSTDLAKDTGTYVIIDPWIDFETMNHEAIKAALRGKHRKKKMVLLADRGGRAQQYIYAGSGDTLYGINDEKQLKAMRRELVSKAASAKMSLTKLIDKPIDSLSARELRDAIHIAENIKLFAKAKTHAVNAMSVVVDKLFKNRARSDDDKDAHDEAKMLARRVAAAKTPVALAALYPEVEKFRILLGLPWEPVLR